MKSLVILILIMSNVLREGTVVVILIKAIERLSMQIAILYFRKLKAPLFSTSNKFSTGNSNRMLHALSECH